MDVSFRLRQASFRFTPVCFRSIWIIPFGPTTSSWHSSSASIMILKRGVKAQDGMRVEVSHHVFENPFRITIKWSTSALTGKSKSNAFLVTYSTNFEKSCRRNKGFSTSCVRRDFAIATDDLLMLDPLLLSQKKYSTISGEELFVAGGLICFRTESIKKAARMLLPVPGAPWSQIWSVVESIHLAITGWVKAHKHVLDNRALRSASRSAS